MNDRIKMVRKEVKLSQEAFGKRLGVTGVAVSRIESGERNPSTQLIRSICREFCVSEDWLRTGNGEMYLSLIDNDIEIITKAMEGCSENKKRLMRLIAQMPDDLLDRMMEYLEGRQKK